MERWRLPPGRVHPHEVGSRAGVGALARAIEEIAPLRERVLGAAVPGGLVAGPTQHALENRRRRLLDTKPLGIESKRVQDVVAHEQQRAAGCRAWEGSAANQDRATAIGQRDGLDVGVVVVLARVLDHEQDQLAPGDERRPAM